MSYRALKDLHINEVKIRLTDEQHAVAKQFAAANDLPLAVALRWMIADQLQQAAAVPSIHSNRNELRREGA